MINPIEDQIAPLVLWPIRNHIFYNQNAPLALLRIDMKFRSHIIYRKHQLIFSASEKRFDCREELQLLAGASKKRIGSRK